MSLLHVSGRYPKLGRQCREAQITLIFVTQRPDVKDAIPGAVRDMLEDRVVLGFVSQKGAQMALEDRWRDAVDNYGEKLPHGRGVARLAGKYSRIQGFYAGDPIDRAESESLFPPKISTHPDHTVALPPSTSSALPAALLDPVPVGTDDGPPDGDHPRPRRRHTA
jgi:DNA segregation ATPase FtsK/SpoIIIE-like protein